ncbi:MAG: Coenzyme F420 hydrogenase/dehydrogenase, beta subunit C-terminal domain [Candidatus Methanofastidiosia archaeon]
MPGFEDLEFQVISQELCSFCGTCINLCPRIGIGELKPMLIDYCTECGMCYAYCHRVGFPRVALLKQFKTEDTEIGPYLLIYEAKGKVEGQDGGVVTTLLKFLFDENLIDSAVVTSDERWNPKVMVARDIKDLDRSKKSKYCLSPTVTGVKDAGKEIAFVGLPCQIQALRKAKFTKTYDVKMERVKYLIGIFCLKNFQTTLLDDFIERKSKINLSEITKLDCGGNRFSVFTDGEPAIQVSLKEISSYVGKGCLVCHDFAADLADISVGSVGASKGFSSVIVRSEKGKDVFEGALKKEYLETRELSNLKKIINLSKKKKRNASKVIEERREKGLRVTRW